MTTTLHPDRSEPERNWREHVDLADRYADELATFRPGTDSSAALVARVVYHTAKALAGMTAEDPQITRWRPIGAAGTHHPEPADWGWLRDQHEDAAREGTYPDSAAAEGRE